MRLGIVLRVFAVWAVLLTVARVAFIVFQGFGGHWLAGQNSGGLCGMGWLWICQCLGMWLFPCAC